MNDTNLKAAKVLAEHTVSSWDNRPAEAKRLFKEEWPLVGLCRTFLRILVENDDLRNNAYVVVGDGMRVGPLKVASLIQEVEDFKRELAELKASP